MDWLKKVARENNDAENAIAITLSILLAVAAVFGALWLLKLGGLLSEGVAAWVQAVGSVWAIISASAISRRQAENALIIHKSEVETRETERREDANRRRQEAENRAREARQDALAEAAVHSGEVKRLELAVRAMRHSVEVALLSLSDAEERLLRAEEQYEAAYKLDDVLMPDLKSLERKAVIKREQAKENLVRRADELKVIVLALGKLPRGVIRIGSRTLAKHLTDAINSVQASIAIIEHSHEKKKSLLQISTAEWALLEYSRELMLQSLHPELSGGSNPETLRS